MKKLVSSMLVSLLCAGVSLPFSSDLYRVETDSSQETEATEETSVIETSEEIYIEEAEVEVATEYISEESEDVAEEEIAEPIIEIAEDSQENLEGEVSEFEEEAEPSYQIYQIVRVEHVFVSFLGGENDGDYYTVFANSEFDRMVCVFDDMCPQWADVNKWAVTPGNYIYVEFDDSGFVINVYPVDDIEIECWC